MNEKTINSEDLKNISVSHATMRLEDLIPAFIAKLKEIDPENPDLLKALNRIEEEVSPAGYTRYNSEAAIFALEELFDKLNHYAPDGYYFGSHPGDGSDYGFWEWEEEEAPF